MYLGILFGLLSSVFFSFGYVSLKKSYSEFPPSVAFMFDSLFGVLIWIPIALFLGINLNNFLTVLPWAILSAILSEAYFFYVISKGKISITGTILASYPIYTVILSRFINNEVLNSVQTLAIVLTILGTLIVSIEKLNLNDLKKRNYILWAISGAIAVGLSDSLSKNAINRVGFQDFLFALALVQIPVALIYLKLEKQKITEIKNFLKKLPKYKFSIIGSFLNVIGVLFLWLAFSATYASIASPLTATYPVLMVILAHFLLKEKINKKDYFGIALVLIGIIVLSFVS
jgi:drug/metabolite transporter (DMT)-like permease